MEVEFTETKRPSTGVIIPAEPAPAPAAAAAPPTADEIQKKKAEAFKAMGWGEPPVEKTPPAPVTSTEPTAAPAAPAPADEPVTVAEPESVATASPEPTTADIIRQTVRQTVSEMQPATAPAPSAPFKMNDADADDYNVLLYLERTEPEKWSGKPAQFLDYVKKHYAYMDKWATEHPGEEYNPDDNDHAAWYDKNQPDIEPEEIKEGRMSMKAEEKAYARVAPELQKITRDRAIQENEPAIRTNVQKNILSMVSKVDPAIAKILSDDKGNPNFSPDNINRLDEHDPIAKSVLDVVVRQQVEPLVMALELSTIPALGMPLNPAVNQTHALIDNFRQKAETDLQSAPPEVRIQNGREFCTLAQMRTMQHNIVSSGISKSDQDAQIRSIGAKYWTLSVDDLEAVIVNHYAGEAKKTIENLDAVAKKKFKPSVSGGQPAAPAPAAPIPARPAPVIGKPNSPGGGSASDVVPTPSGGAQQPKSFAETAADRHFRK